MITRILRKNFFKKIIGNTIALFMMVMTAVPMPALAIIYSPGATLNPSCLPTDADCNVNTALFLSTGLNVGSATSTPPTTTNQIYNVGGALYWNGSPLGLALTGTQGQIVTFNATGAQTATSTLFIAPGGNIGIGTNTPTANLSFGATTATINNAATNGVLTISSNGTGGITLAPGASGTIQLGNSPSQNIFVAAGGFIIDSNPEIFSVGQVIPGGAVARNALRFSEPSFVNGVVTTGGNYVGLQSPVADLATTTVWSLPAGDGASGQVLSTNGSGALSWATSAPSQWTTSGANVYYNTGNVGIGTSAPSAALDVAGITKAISFNVTSTTSPYQINGATVLNVGTGTTFVGSGAGINNQALGVGATFVGSNAGKNNTTGFYNTAMGEASLAFNTSGSSNTAMGITAINANTTGSNNSAFGSEALKSNVTGSSNTAIGTNVLYGSTGSFNTAVGSGALLLATTGNNNTANGFGSGMLMTTGSNNVLYGYYAGDNITTGNNNLIIGYNIDAPSATGSNQLSIGNLIFGTGLNATGTAISTGNVGIGTTTPNTKLAVNATGSENPFSVGGSLQASVFPSYTYRAPITVTAAGALTNYQTSIVVNTAALVIAGKMQSNGNDIRITASDGTTLQNYWIETGTMNTAATRIWFKAASLASGANTFYLYYGNPSATAVSNGDNVFVFFDDFNGSAVDAAKWIVDDSTGVSIAGGSLNATNSNGKLRSQWSYAGTSVVQETQFISNSDSAVTSSIMSHGGFWASATDGVSFIRYNNASMSNVSECLFLDAGPFPTNCISGGTVPSGNEYLSRVSVISGTQATQEFYNYATNSLIDSLQTITNTVSNGERILLIRDPRDITSGAPLNTNIRFVRVRAYAASEPTTSAGAEGATPTMPTPSTFLTINSGGNVLPGMDNAFSLGSATNKWKDLYLAGSTLYLGDQSLSNSSGSLTWSGTSMQATPSATSSTEMRLSELSGNGSSYTGFKSPDSLLANILYTLPSADATSSGQVLSSNGTGVLSWATPASGGIASLNGLTASSQTFVAGTTGSDFGVVSSGSAHTFNLPDAGATARGFVSTSTQTIAGAKTFSGSLSLSPMTQGSLLFAGASGLVSQNNTGLFWDNTNNRLGIGTTAPTAGLEVTPINAIATQWTLRSGADFGNKSVVYGNGTFVSVPDTNVVFTSSDGITWTTRSVPVTTSLSVAYGNGLFVAVGTNSVITSPDGITWTSRTPAANNNWYSVAYGNGLFVAVATSGTGNRVMTSPDGITWTSRTSASNDLWRGITYGNGLFVAVSFLGSTYGAMTSSDGITWTGRTTPSEAFNEVTYGNGLFVAVSEGGATGVATSPDGITWTSRTPAANLFWRGVTFGNGLFVAVAGSGTGNRVMTSPDGITWTSRTSPADNNWNGIAFGNNLFVAVADSGTTRVMTANGALPTALVANGSITVNGHIAPVSNAAYDLGSATNRFRSLYLSGTTLYIGDQSLSNSSGSLTWSGTSIQATPSATSATDIKLSELSGNGSSYTGFKSPDSLVANVLYTLPNADGANGQVLSTNGSGTLAWTAGSSQWTASGANVYYNTGNVAIGTSTPSATARLLIVGAVPATNQGLNAGNGAVTTIGSDTVVTYATTGTNTFTPPTGVTSVRVLAIGGGGSGGVGIGGGAGAGEYYHNTSLAVTPGTPITVTVGAGGASVTGDIPGNNGGDSIFGTVTARGGGGGGGWTSIAGKNGGSGGGANGGNGNANGGTSTAVSPGLGNVGGSWNGGTNNTVGVSGAGGGGAGGVGQDGSTTAAASGGAGLNNNITGSTVGYAGGGGATRLSSSGGTATHGGGAGSSNGETNGIAGNGTSNTGGGGGGARGNVGISGSGGSGVVIVRFVTQNLPAQQALLRVTDTGSVASSTLAFFEGTSGQGCIIAGNTGLSCSSDITLKKNVNGLENSLGNVLALKPVTFDWNNEVDGAGNHIGFIAQDVEKLFPGLVVTDPNGKKALAYDRFAPILTKAIQEISAKIDRVLTVLENGWRRLTADELCLTDSAGALVCVTGDQLRGIGGATPQNNADLMRTNAEVVMEPAVTATTTTADTNVTTSMALPAVSATQEGPTLNTDSQGQTLGVDAVVPAEAPVPTEAPVTATISPSEPVSEPILVTEPVLAPTIAPSVEVVAESTSVLTN